MGEDEGEHKWVGVWVVLRLGLCVGLTLMTFWIVSIEMCI